MRKIYQQVHTSCHNSGIHIPAVSFDGQWHNIAVRSVDKKPLTVFQLMKDVWYECVKAKKTLVVKEYATLNKSFTLVIDSNKCILTNNSANIPKGIAIE
jgi:hypothetical protein